MIPFEDIECFNWLEGMLVYITLIDSADAI